MDYTVFVTVLSGVLTYVVGQLVVKLLIDPVQAMNKTIGQVAHSLTFLANVTGNPGLQSQEIGREASKQLRQLSSELESHLYLVPKYRQTAWLFRLPNQKEVLKSRDYLIGLSNSVEPKDPRGTLADANAKRVESIRDSLGLYMSDSERVPKS